VTELEAAEKFPADEREDPLLRKCKQVGHCTQTSRSSLFGRHGAGETPPGGISTCMRHELGFRECLLLIVGLQQGLSGVIVP